MPDPKGCPRNRHNCTPWTIPALVLAGLLVTETARSEVIVLQHSVDATHNLYFDAWGHPYASEFSELLVLPGWWDLDPEPYGLSAGVAAPAVAADGGPFNFATLGKVAITASGWVQDNDTWWTDVDGDGWEFRGLSAYGLIGLWSSSPDRPLPLYWQEPHPAFFVGSHALLNVPRADAVYLFLANNDGWFFDNQGAYSVELRTWAVPEPPALLLVSMVLAMALRRRGA